MHNFVLRRRRWVARAFGRNPVLRWTDRVEACVILAAILLALAVCPLCVAHGDGVYRSHAQLYAAQARTRHLVTASVVAKGNPSHLPHTTTAMVLAVWSDGADGARGGESQAQHAKWVTTDRSVADGDQIRVWVDDAGTPVDAPTPPSMAASEAVAIAAGTWGAAIVGLIAIVAVLRSPLNRIRVTQLDREIKRFASGGTPNLSQ